VNANDRYRRPPCRDFEVAVCNLKFSAYFAVSCMRKSLGNLAGGLRGMLEQRLIVKPAVHMK
jgi:hypothetical protein